MPLPSITSATNCSGLMLIWTTLSTLTLTARTDIKFSAEQKCHTFLPYQSLTTGCTGLTGTSKRSSELTSSQENTFKSCEIRVIVLTTFTFITHSDNFLSKIHVETTMEAVVISAFSILLTVTHVVVQITLSCNQITRHAEQIAREDSIVVEERMIDAFQSIGHVTVKRIVLTDLMKKTALLSLANQECSSVKTTRHAFLEFESVMASLIAVIDQMKHIVTVHVVNMHSSVDQREGVFQTLGNVTETTTVLMVLMKIQLNVTNESVILKHNSNATTESVSPNSGSVTLKTTVETILMNLLIVVETKIVQLDGRNVPHETTTDVFHRGYFVMEKTTAETAPMNPIQNTVPNVMKLETLSVEMEDVSHCDGDVTLRTIVVTTQMKTVQCVPISIVNVLRVNSNVETRSVFQVDGDVIMTTIAMTDPMKRTARITSVKQINSNVEAVTASSENLFAMDTKTVETSLMR